MTYKSHKTSPHKASLQKCRFIPERGVKRHQSGLKQHILFILYSSSNMYSIFYGHYYYY